MSPTRSGARAPASNPLLPETALAWTTIPYRTALILVIALALLPASARAATVLSFVPDSGEITCDEQLDVEIHVDAGAVDLRGLTLKFTYDPTLLDLVDVFPGQLFVDAPCDPFLYTDPTPPGVLQIDIAGLGCSVDGPGAVARVRFEGKSTDGISPLLGIAATLRDSANQGIGATWDDGQILVSCPVPNETTSWSALKAEVR